MWRLTMLAILVVVGLSTQGQAQTASRAITVIGQASVEAAPDMAIINLGVTHEAKEADDAMDAVSNSITRILEQLSSLDFEDRDVQTSQFSVNPVWSNYNSSDNQRRRITGFVASNTISVRVRNLLALGRILDNVIAGGANNFNGLQFTLQDPKPFQEAARAAAVLDAMERAAQLAQVAGVTLGPVQSMSENGGGRPPVVMEMSMARDGGAAIAAGEVSVSASVTMEFEILD